MQKIFLSVIAALLFSFVLTRTSLAATRFATCDACGLCPIVVNDPTDPTCTVTKPDPLDASKVIKLYPSDWQKCVECLYPSLTNPNPAECKTLQIKDDNTSLNPVTPGRQYTMLGCVTSGAQVGFNNASGASSFVQKLLDVIFGLSGALAFLYLMYGGFIFLTSQADPEKLNYGRRLIYGAIAGLIITLSSVFIVNLIGSGILHIPGFSGTP